MGLVIAFGFILLFLLPSIIAGYFLPKDEEAIKRHNPSLNDR